MAKHGYEVRSGYFVGVCQGDRAAPMQVDRSVTDSIIIAVLAQSAKEEARAEALESGREVLDMVSKPGEYLRPGESPTMVAWKDLPVWDARDVLKLTVYRLRSRAKMGRDFAKELGKVADQVHGQPLREVSREDGPAPIRIGEKRMQYGRVTAVTRVQSHRVYWAYTKENGAVSNGWTGTQSWRKLELVTEDSTHE